MLALLDRPSAFRTRATPLEGLVIRLDNLLTKENALRTKLVRLDFSRGIQQHGAARTMARNRLSVDAYAGVDPL